ncbi:MAG: hypothetical protein ACFFCX_14950 [Candidatus Sifarchaeia archaeon]
MPQVGKSAPIQKGLLLSIDGSQTELCEEGVGFGVPILQYKQDFYFSGTSTVSNFDGIDGDPIWKSFVMNLVDRRQRTDSSRIGMFSWVFQRIYNRIYKSRYGRRAIRPITTRLDSVFSEPDPSVFFKVKSKGSITSSYLINQDEGTISVELDFSEVQKSGLQHIYISNELGGSLFFAYTDSSGISLQGDEIGAWDEIRATWAEFRSPLLNIAFRIDIPKGVQAFRGREIIGSDICWSGVIFMLSSSSKGLKYEITVRSKIDRSE